MTTLYWERKIDWLNNQQIPGAETFLRDWPYNNCSRNFLMKFERWLLWLQELVTESSESSPHSLTVLLQHQLWYPIYVLIFREVSFSKNFKSKLRLFSNDFLSLYVPNPSHTLLRDSNDTHLVRIQVITILITWFSSSSLHFLSFKSKY